MPASAIAHVLSITPRPELVEYLARIARTLELHGGRFLVHGNPADVREGDFRGDLIVIESPDHDRATSLV